MASRENADGSMTYWQDHMDEPDDVQSGLVHKVAKKAESKVVDTPDEPAPKKSAKAEGK